MVAALSTASRLAFSFSLFAACDLCACRSFGIELMDHPAHYAGELLSKSAVSVILAANFLFLHTVHIRFQSSAQQNGVSHAPIQLLHGDFLKSSAVREAMSSAGLVYMNNPKFGPELNLKVLGQFFFLTTKLLLFVHELVLKVFIR